MAADGSGILVHWIVDGKGAGIGYFQKWSLPAKGDEVIFLPSGDESQQVVEILFRRFTQPEFDLPRIELHARRIS